MLASACTVLDHDHDFSDPFNPHQAREGVVAAATVIEDSVFLGERVIVLKGVRIGNGSVIGANSVVCSDIPPLTMAAGIPARALRRWSESTGKWERIAAPNSADSSGRSGVGH
jgi:acetyltransferase-like isoleucine patch superfamily enzyme